MIQGVPYIRSVGISYLALMFYALILFLNLAGIFHFLSF